jgi:hypothetical protein
MQNKTDAKMMESFNILVKNFISETGKLNEFLINSKTK